MHPFSIIAPGKVVIAGEYAVVEGGEAIVAAVTSGVRCDYTPNHELQIFTPDADTRFVSPALNKHTGTFRFSNVQAHNLEHKAGTGGSAAATVASVFASRLLAGHPTTAKAIVAQAKQIHHTVQGSGSGVDVVSSTYGGLRHVTPTDVHPLRPSEFVVVYSGTSVKTGPRVQRYLSLPQAYRQEFVLQSNLIVRLWSDDPIACLESGGRLLEEMCQQAKMPYLTPGLEQIRDTARALGGAAKPSGAGGGDVAVAVFEEEEQKQRFLALISEKGFYVLPVSLARGVHLLPQSHSSLPACKG